MKKFLFGLVVVGLANASVSVLPSSPVSIYNNNQPVKPVNVVSISNPQDIGYWNAFFKPIQACIQEAIKTQLKHTDMPKKEYIKSLGLGSGYYVLVNTKDYKLSDVCYLKYELQRKGYSPIYEEPIDTLIVGIFQRKPDALAVADKLRAININSSVKYIHSLAEPQLTYNYSVYNSNNSVVDGNDDDYITKREFVKVIKTINKQFKNQNIINQQLYEEVQQLRQEIAQLKEEKEEKKKENLVVAKAVSSANVRSCPGLQCGVVKTLNKGDKVYLLGYSGDWAKIKFHKNSKNVYYVYKAFIVTQ